MNAKVSIIIPFYNSEKTIDNTMKSIINQTYTNIEIILIDDCSTDNSKENCSNWIERDNRIKYLKNDKCKGVSYSRNIGLKLASGKYVCFVDSDDIIEKNFIEDFISIINNNTDIVACDFFKFNTEENIPKNTINDNYLNKKINEYNRKDIYKMLFEKFNGYVWNKMYRMKTIRDNNIFFNEEIDMCEDMLFNFEYMKYCQKALSINKKNYFYRCDYSTSSKNIFNKKWFTVLSSYERILDMNAEYSYEIYYKVIYIYIKYLIEAKQRIKKMNLNEVEINKKKIQYKLRKMYSYFFKLPFKCKLKILVFYFFPNISFKYIRRKVMN